MDSLNFWEKSDLDINNYLLKIDYPKLFHIKNTISKLINKKDLEITKYNLWISYDDTCIKNYSIRYKYDYQTNNSLVVVLK